VDCEHSSYRLQCTENLPVPIRKDGIRNWFPFWSCCFRDVEFCTAPQSPASQAAISVEGAAPVTITLQDAMQRARQNDPQFRSALTDLGLAREDRVQARAGLLRI